MNLSSPIIFSFIDVFYDRIIQSDLNEFKKQCMWISISIPIMIVILFIDYNIFCEN